MLRHLTSKPFESNSVFMISGTFSAWVSKFCNTALEVQDHILLPLKYFSTIEKDGMTHSSWNTSPPQPWAEISLFASSGRNSGQNPPGHSSLMLDLPHVASTISISSKDKRSELGVRQCHQI